MVGIFWDGKKLERYSTVISGLGQLICGGNRTEVERLATKSIDDLVSDVEDQIHQ